ncbi:hypothetical protein GCM10020358_69120 [Amorphoplanes nipponensis]|uniref:Uncharacterized protein n=1 Tax=Actinoplanes nipponensis TaxID=135950 RepID=A0A919MQJ4_9ACTN|nr:hypothetical protein [Actinoplanes nipponensis]GIE53197.1 hypothetical protein Ani05nite_67310 [Actinoplanes nipponensis]
MTELASDPAGPALPAYLLRYPNPWGLEHRREKGLEELRYVVARCRFGYIGLRLDEVLEIVRRLDEQPAGTASLLVDDLIDRIGAMTIDEVEQLVDVLLDLHRRDMPGWCRLDLDRGLQRLLFLLRVPKAHDLAYECARSERTYRRWAAYKFYGEHGLDERARRLLAGQVAAGTIEQPSSAAYSYYPGALVARDQTLVNRLGLAAVLAVAPTTQQRKEAIEFAMAQLAPETVAGICEDYPQELVWAVRSQGRTDYLPIIMDMVDDYRDDPYLLHRVVECLTRIGGTAEIDYAVHVASKVLESAAVEL